MTQNTKRCQEKNELPVCQACAPGPLCVASLTGAVSSPPPLFPGGPPTLPSSGSTTHFLSTYSVLGLEITPSRSPPTFSPAPCQPPRFPLQASCSLSSQPETLFDHSNQVSSRCSALLQEHALLSLPQCPLRSQFPSAGVLAADVLTSFPPLVHEG